MYSNVKKKIVAFLFFPAETKKQEKKKRFQVENVSMSRSIRSLRFLGGTGLALGLGTYLDQKYYYSNLTRCCRTLYNGIGIVLDYKVFFNESSDVSKVHSRVAHRILHTCRENGGLYVKLGQGISQK